ncbi:hypothetical protein [Protaetiibacter intestinalis]|uniref:hypothetical protein n=1 Tax=Protaetiibacter intestinalis TaxID=2419774 RepID=UPI0013008BCF|nr:hypothetical protein [Protaetiibacter intestinalis]
MPFVADTAPGFPVALVVVVELVGVIVAAGLVVRRMRRAPQGPAEADAASASEVLWGLHVPGTPVQRMGRTLAIGFAMFDPDEASNVVRSTDGGANWYVVPRDKWGDAE